MSKTVQLVLKRPEAVALGWVWDNCRKVWVNPETGEMRWLAA